MSAASRLADRRRPSVRVRLAMTRITRDRWMSARDVESTAFRLAQCASGSPDNVVSAAIADETRVVGMLRGVPPAYSDDPMYCHYVAALKGLKRDRRATAEMLILKLTISGASRGR